MLPRLMVNDTEKKMYDVAVWDDNEDMSGTFKAQNDNCWIKN